MGDHGRVERITISHPDLGETEIFPTERTIEHFKAMGWKVPSTAKKKSSKPDEGEE